MIHERMRLAADGTLAKRSPAVATPDGPSAEFDCPGCDRTIRTSVGRIGTLVPFDCDHCDWDGVVRLHLDGEDPPEPEREIVTVAADVDGPSAVFPCPGCGDDLRTSKSRIGEGAIPFDHDCGWQGAVEIRASETENP